MAGEERLGVTARELGRVRCARQQAALWRSERLAEGQARVKEERRRRVASAGQRVFVRAGKCGM